MKHSNLIIVLLIVLFSSCVHQDKSKVVSGQINADIHKIEVIDFYGTHRCVTCKAIEASTKYTVDTYFANEPKVVFKTVNVDDEANYAIAESFEATGTALFLNVIKEGKERHIDLTDFAFSKGTEQEEFSKELKTKIESELKKL